MKLQTTDHGDDRDLALVESYSDQLAALGVLSTKGHSEIATHLERAEEAHVLVSGIERERARAIDSAAAKLAANEVTTEKITSAAEKIAANDAVHDLGLAIWRVHIQAAKQLVRNAFDAVPEVLNAELAAVSARGLAAAEALGGVASAEAAIGAGLVDDWKALQDAEREYRAIMGMVSRLRGDNILPSSRSYDPDSERWAFLYRREPQRVVHAGYRANGYTPAEKRMRLIEEWRSEPYVPASREDVDAVLASVRETEVAA